jgi:hypothetical protein
MGAEGLTSLLANYTRNKGVKTSIRVGVVGKPVLIYIHKHTFNKIWQTGINSVVWKIKKKQIILLLYC